MNVTKTPEENELILRFLRAAGERVQKHSNRMPIDSKLANLTINWLRALVGKLGDDGELEH